MPGNRYYILFLIFIYSVTAIGSKNYIIKNFTNKDGLAYNHIRNIVQDKSGFLWIATWDGISCYDGYNFRNYYHVIGDSTSLPEFSILNIEVDSTDNIWVKSYNKVAVYNRNQDNFLVFNSLNNKTFPFEQVFSITKDIHGKIWLSGDKGICFYDTKTNAFQLVDFSSDITEDLNSRFIFCFDNEGYLYVGGEKISKFRVKNFSKEVKLEEIASFKFNFQLNYIEIPNNYRLIFDFQTDTSGNSWLFTNTKTYLLNKSNNTFELYYGAIPLELFYGEKPIYWIENGTHIKLYLPSVKKSYDLPKRKDDFFCSFLIDNQGSVWYSLVNKASVSDGLYFYREIPDFFDHYLNVPINKDELISVSGLIADNDGNLIVGTRNFNYLLRLSNNGALSKINSLNNDLWKQTIHPRSFEIDNNGNIWIGYFNFLLSKYFPDNQSIQTIYLNTDISTADSLPYIFRIVKPLENGNLLISSGGSIFLFDPVKKQPIKKVVSELSAFYCIFQAKDGIFWAGANYSKLFKIDTDFNLIGKYEITRDKLDINIEDICEIDSVYLWMATIGGGLCRFNRINGTSKFYTTANGLSNNVTYSIISDKSKNLWISTNDGISKFDPATETFKLFGEQEGLKIKEFNSDAAYKDKLGNIYFGGQGGVVKFNPDSDLFQGTNPNSKLLFTEFSVSGQVLKDGEEIYNRKKAVLKKGSNNFQLVVICTDLKNSAKIRYRYRIEEIDKNWIETGKNNRRISYSGLNPGYYTLKVQSTNINGVWENDNTLKIIIPPYFYQTNLFLILIYLLISVIIIFVVAMIIRKIKLKEKMETEKLKTHFSDLKRRNELLRLESLQGQMNPHFLFNSLNSINYFIAISDKISANQYISGFARLIRAILNNSKNQYIPFKQEFEALDDYLRLEHLRFGDKFNYQINCEETMLTDGIELSPSMVQPFVENAIWHGLRLLEDRIGYLTVNFKVKNENCIECIIEDNGVGRVLAEERKSSEMKARKSRGIEIIIEKLKIFNSLNQSNYSVVIEDLFPEKKETGTKVTIEIPARFIYN